jgi:hypothetical protein
MMANRLVILAVAVMTLAAAPQSLKAADEDALCPLGNETLHGNYMSISTGTIVGVGPITAVGRTAYDGKGSAVNPYTVSVNGVISTGTGIGIYTVNSDCTGSVVTTDGAHYSFVITPDGSTFDWIDIDPGRVFSGTAIRLTRRLEPADEDALCPAGNATLRGPLMTQATGYIVGVGPIAVVGLMTYDGKGGGVLVSTLSVNGAISQGTFTATYTVNSDCTMTQTMSNGTNYVGVVAPDGSTSYWMEIDPGTVISGTSVRLGH